MAAKFRKFAEVLARNGDGTYAAFDWDSDDIRVALVDTGASGLNRDVDVDTDVTVDDISAGIVSRSASLTGKDATNGVLDADDTLFATVAAGDACERLVIYRYDALDTAALLLFVLDDTDVTGLPVTPNNANINVVWDDGANKIAKL